MVVILKDGALVGSEVFPPGVYRIGRAPSSDLRLDDPMISAHHASLALRGGQIGIRDEGSANGIWLNGERVALAKVTSKDELEIRPYTLKVRLLEKGERTGAATSSVEETVIAPVSARSHLAAVPALADETQENEPTLENPVRKPAPAPDVLTPRRLKKRGSEERPARKSSPGAPHEPTPAGPFPPSSSPGTAPSARALAGELVPELATVPSSPPESILSALAGKDKPAHGERPALPRPVALRPKGAVEPRAAESEGGEEALAPVPEGAPPVLRAKLLWGRSIIHAQAFRSGGVVSVGASDGAAIPVYGWPLQRSSTRVAAFREGAWKVVVPQGLRAYALGPGGRARPTQGPVSLSKGEGVVLVAGKLALELCAELPSPTVPLRFRPEIDKQLLVPLVGAALLLGLFFLFMPKKSELPDFTPKALPAIRAILEAPKKHPKEKPPKAKKSDQQRITKERSEGTHEKVARSRPASRRAELPVPQSQAIAAVEKILGGGKATKQLFSAVSKIGKGRGGGGLNFKASGLLGKVPLGVSGGGGLTLGAGLGHGGGTKGAWAFGGLGGLGGPGALGRGGVGRRGVLGGVVSAPRRGGKVAGLLPMEAVRRVVDEHIAEIQQCYENALLRTPGLTGKVVLEWTIGLSGGVERVTTKVSTLRSPGVAGCAVESLRRWRFPRPKGGVVVVSYPFLFNSVGY